jgi:hypothetical protein
MSRFGQRSTINQSSIDRGRIASTAVRAKTIGELIVCVADAYDISLTELGRKSGLKEGKIGSICNGDVISHEEWRQLKAFIQSMVHDVCAPG